MIRTRIIGAQEVREALRKEMDKITDGAKFVLVGIHEDAGEGGGDLTMAQLGAVHEFGADIDHPGGTPYGYKTKEDAEAHRIRFLKKGEGHKVLGVTGPHVISIPARPWLVPGVENGEAEYIAEIEDGIKKGLDNDTILGRIGGTAVGFAQKAIDDKATPPNAPSTIKKKGFNNPLVVSGAMKQSVTFSLSDRAPDEGLR